MRAITVGMWIVSLICLTIASVLAAAFVFMAASLDPTDLLTVGTEPWTNALLALVAMVGFAVLIALSLKLWHTARFKAVGLALTLVEIGGIAWACHQVYSEYF